MTFKNVTASEYDCVNIKLLNSAGEEMDDTNTGTPSRRSRNKVMFQKLDVSSGNVLVDVFKYNSQSGKGWCLNGTSLTAGQCTFKSGEGVYINNTQGEVVKLLVSGEVDLDPISMPLPGGYTILGNMTPVPVDVRNIKVLNSAMEEMDDTNTTTPSRRSRNKVMFQKLNATTGNVLVDVYKYNTQSNKGWCLNGTSLTEDQCILQPGESVYLNNTQGDVIYLKFPAPYNQ